MATASHTVGAGCVAEAATEVCHSFVRSRNWNKELCPARVTKEVLAKQQAEKNGEKPERKDGPQKTHLEEILMSLTKLEKKHWKKGRDLFSGCKTPRNDDSQEKIEKIEYSCNLP